MKETKLGASWNILAKSAQYDIESSRDTVSNSGNLSLSGHNSPWRKTTQLSKDMLTTVWWKCRKIHLWKWIHDDSRYAKWMVEMLLLCRKMFSSEIISSSLKIVKFKSTVLTWRKERVENLNISLTLKTCDPENFKHTTLSSKPSGISVSCLK